MILIADSGSTKTHWCSVDGGVVRELVTQGLNPRLTDDHTLLTVFRHAREQLGSPDALFFYGAGCGSREMQQRMASQLSVVFTKATCHCEGDLLGACRALCGDNAGMVGILGTGSNLCYYDGSVIARQRTSTGYILGDEGSGNHIGRRLLKDYLEERMPTHLRAMFHDSYGMTHSQLLDRLYSQPYPNRFLASFSHFCYEHKEHPAIQELLYRHFNTFVTRILLQYYQNEEEKSQMPVGFVGSIAYYYKDILNQVLNDYHLHLGQILQDPIEGLKQYHAADLEPTT